MQINVNNVVYNFVGEHPYESYKQVKNFLQCIHEDKVSSWWASLERTVLIS